MTRKKFEKLALEALKTIPEKFLKRLENVEIVIEEQPSLQQLRKLKNKKSLIFGLYEGIPKTKRWHYRQVLPDKITIFKKSIESVASSEKEVRAILRKTIWHEIAHHFGFEEKEIRELEKRKKIK